MSFSGEGDSFAGLEPDTFGVLTAAGTPADFTYADGAEVHLLDLIRAAEDRSPWSGELPALAHDWPTHYHLSPQRWALVDGLDLPRGRVLELGAGCGALTAWLAEHHDAVDALEGNPLRAAVTRERCAGHEHVRVIAGDLLEFVPVPRYDVVTLIGVLEYARCFGRTKGLPPREATRAMLAHVQGWLAPGGVLLIAIENQFGLKYLAGHVEDHTAGAFDGIEGYQQDWSAVTFTRSQLVEDLASSGLVVDDLVLPFPDYKLPETLINAADIPPGAAAWVTTPWTERGTDRLPSHFNEALALIEAERGGLLAELSNSFLLLARAQEHARGPQLAWSLRHYTLARQPALRKRKTLAAGEDGVLGVTVESLARGAEPSAGLAALGIGQVLEDEAFRAGDLLGASLLRPVAGSRYDAVVELLRRHAVWLVETYAVDGVADGRLDPARPLAPEAYDAHLLNIVVGPDGRWGPIDLEWRPDRPVALSDVSWRAARILLVRWKYLLLPDEERPVGELAAALAANALGVEMDVLGWRGAEYRELMFQDAVRGRELSGPAPLRRLAVRNAELLAELGKEAHARDKAQRAAAERRHENAGLQGKLDESRSELAAQRVLIEGARAARAAAEERLAEELPRLQAHLDDVRAERDARERDLVQLRERRIVRLTGRLDRLRGR